MFKIQNSKQNTNQNSKQFWTEKGFTLAEMLVVIFIIGVLTAIVVPNYMTGKKQIALLAAANKLASDIRYAEQLALSAKGHEECKTPGGDYQNDYKFGYGIVFLKDVNNRYSVFADCNGNNKYQHGQQGQADDEVISGGDVAFESGIEIQSPFSKDTSVVFTPPDPKVSFSPVNLTSILVTLKNGISCQAVGINSRGAVSVQPTSCH